MRNAATKLRFDCREGKESENANVASMRCRFAVGWNGENGVAGRILLVSYKEAAGRRV